MVDCENLLHHRGMIWAYMGPADQMPELPALEMALLPASHRFVTKKWQDCNWVQAVEGSIDTAHFTFAHLSFEKEENEILDIKKHFVNPLTRVATDHMFDAPCPASCQHPRLARPSDIRLGPGERCDCLERQCGGGLPGYPGRGACERR